MSSNPTNLVVSPFTPRTKLVDEDGYATWEMLKFSQGLAQAVNNALDILGQFNGVIGTGATVQGHPGTLAGTIQHLTPSGQLTASQLIGTIAPAQLPAADPVTQGAVILPAGAPSNVLDSAAFQPVSAFDPAGAAAAAQAAAEAASDPAGSAATAEANANAYTTGRFGITYGTGAPAGVPSTTFALYFDTTGSPYHGYVYNAGAWHQFS